MAGLAAIFALAVAGGGLLNAARRTPLPLWYSAPAVRAAEAAKQEGRAEIRLISLEEFMHAQAQGRVLVLDARPALFYQFAHIPGAVSLSKEDFDRQFTELLPRLRSDAAANGVVIYCSGGDCEDSAYVAERLSREGIAPLAIYEGGWDEWQQSQGNGS